VSAGRFTPGARVQGPITHESGWAQQVLAIERYLGATK